ncbi:S-layer homology domain-containing protein [Salimicrobium flavidum]|uniref:L,D-peptidoglycan transpeptidase YkuD, ErfK/YbiS/YcfS/YnhG family n=1 Tax=Salimicrobium flavidum TaxID=570947 RepID=A0A1N7IU74_9BACI|nr:S-layer homology domain-containing protein [Salimicrobium flavidum]SIS40655.1 L,D-peptidoglycan transpeptidase YkuD, ErfK/YbiS/YcfS/YnhG family [Salimicrobium flavidum]
MLKRTIPLLALVSLFFTLPSIVQAGSFKDVPSSYWGYEEIEYIAERGAIEGYLDGTYRSGNDVTREQAFVIIQRAFNLETADRPAPSFTDVSPNHWTYPAIAAVVDEGWYPDKQKLDPTGGLTREEMASIISHAFDLSQPEKEQLFIDVPENDAYFEEIQALASHRISQGFGNAEFKPDKTVTRAEFAAFVARGMNESFRSDSTITPPKQKIVVEETSGFQATLTAYEKRDGSWRKATNTMSAVLGKDGAGQTWEGDPKTPVGTYSLGTGFGWGNVPSGMTYPYRPVDSNDYWIDDTSSSQYNQWVEYDGNPYARWSSFERLNIDLYKHAVAINYNKTPIVPGAGSAIFLHVWRGPGSPTLGCIGMSETDLETIMTWLDDEKHPYIEIRE